MKYYSTAIIHDSKYLDVMHSVFDAPSDVIAMQVNAAAQIGANSDQPTIVSRTWLEYYDSKTHTCIDDWTTTKHEEPYNPLRYRLLCAEMDAKLTIIRLNPSSN